jgi:mannitol-1-/sugar-/sorbitol-6-phosphatase
MVLPNLLHWAGVFLVSIYGRDVHAGDGTIRSMARTLLASVTVSVRGVLLDMDGVLINSTDADERCWLRWARFHGMEGAFSIQSTHGRRAVDTLRALRPDLDPMIELRRLEDFDAEDQSGAVVLPGAKPLIASLPENVWTIVTSAPESLMRNRLMSAGISMPQNFVSADDVTHGKPHPEPYEMGARVLGFKPSECLVIEDAPAGIKAGKAAGCRVLAVLSSHSAVELTDADWIVPSLEHVTAAPSDDGTIRIRLDV